MNARQLMIIVLAGVACALTVLTAGRMGAGAVPVLMLGSFPIYLASLAFGTSVGVGASILAILITGFIGSPQTAMVVGLAFTIPASFIGHQANLAQHHEDGSVEWFPLSQLFFNLCAVVAVGLLALGYVINYDTSSVSQQMNDAVGQILKQNPQSGAVSEAEIQSLSEGVLRLLPFVFSGIWLIMHVINLYLASMAARSLNLMPRPKDDIPATINMAKPGIFILLISIVCASFLSGTVQILSAVVAGIFIMGFALIGLANMHYNSRGNPGGIILIVIAYALIVIAYIPIYFFAITGIFRNINGNPKTTPSDDGS